MPRIARGLADGEIYHIINRGNRKSKIFHDKDDYDKFIKLIIEAKKLVYVSIYGFALMPNHFHFIAKPAKGEDLSRFMQWLLTSYVRHYNKKYKTSGHLWQGRYKSFIVQKDSYLLTLIRYIEQNPIRARLKEWEYVSSNPKLNSLLDTLPVSLPKDWDKLKTEIINPKEKKRIINSIQRQTPYGEEKWVYKTACKYDMLSTINPIGRPKKIIKDDKK